MKLKALYRRSLSLLIFSSVVSLSGCGTNTHGLTDKSQPDSSAAASQKLTNVTLATLPVADSALAVYAEKHGIFQRNGLNVKFDIVQTGPATTSAVVSGAAQFSQSNYATLFQAKSHGVPLEIVADAANATPDFSYVLTTSNSQIKTPQDLVGKRIATSVIGGIGPVAISYWLQQHGINYKSIQWVQMPFQDMGAALERHQVDAVWVVEPFSTLMTKKDHDRVIFKVFSGPTAGWPVSAFVTSNSYAKSHPNVIEAFVKSLEQAALAVAHNSEAIREVLPTYTSLSVNLANQIALETYPVRTNVDQIKLVADAMYRTGFLSAPFDPSTMVWGAH